MSWGVDVEDMDEETENEDSDVNENTTENVEVAFVDQFTTAVESGDVEDITTTTLQSKYKELDDVAVLQEAIEQDTRSSACEVYERRLQQLEPDEDVGDGEESQSEQSEAVDDNEEDTPSLDDIEMDNLAETNNTEKVEESVTPPAINADTTSIEELDVKNIAPNAKNVREAAEQDYLWRILGWAEPGKGKTHFGFTMPEPICLIDTEGKAHNLASKFEDTVTYIWQPDDWDGARESLDEAISVLEQYLAKGHRGTIVVDSMSEMWEWSKQKYVSKVYNGKSLDEVNLSANIGSSGQSDWKIIKRYHNQRFRAVMLDTPFHVYWTAMQTDDFEQILEGAEGNPKKPVGERDNAYKVDQVLHITDGADGAPVGNLKKNGLSKYTYRDLRYPTFPKHKEACERIRDVEDDGKDPMLEDALGGLGVVTEGDPEGWEKNDD